MGIKNQHFRQLHSDEVTLQFSCYNHGGERSRLWMLSQGKRAEEARMISLTNNLCKKIIANNTVDRYDLAA